MIFKLVVGVTIISSGYILVKLFFDILLRGFAPIISSRPWVVEVTLNNLKLKKYSLVYGLGSGRSGFLHEFKKMYPQTEVIAIEHDRFPYLVAKVQIIVRWLFFHSAKIKVIRAPIYKIEISQADFVYCHLYPDHMAGLGKKLRFEVRPGTPIVSNGFLIPDLEPKKIVTLPERKGRLAWLSRDKGLLFKSKRKKSKKENKVFFYEI